jgi:hypothetical protein
VSRIFPILLLLMGLAVATREIPELYNLADDPSNDGEVFICQGQTSLCTTHRVRNEEVVLPARTIALAHIENLSFSSVVPAKTGQDILRLVASLRT